MLQKSISKLEQIGSTSSGHPLKAFYAQTESWLAAIRLRFAGIKGKLLAAVSMAATAIVAFHDFILANAFGIDWTPVTI